MRRLVLLVAMRLAVEGSQSAHVERTTNAACPDAGFYLENRTRPHRPHPTCHLCFCEKNQTAICWERYNKKCDADSYSGFSSPKRRKRDIDSDNFIQDASKGRNVGSKECTPYESTHSVGCPPADWCAGCVVCDCDGDGRWLCHTLSFCVDDKGHSSAVTVPFPRHGARSGRDAPSKGSVVQNKPKGTQADQKQQVIVKKIFVKGKRGSANLTNPAMWRKARPDRPYRSTSAKRPVEKAKHRKIKLDPKTERPRTKRELNFEDIVRNVNINIVKSIPGISPTDIAFSEDMPRVYRSYNDSVAISSSASVFKHSDDQSNKNISKTSNNSSHTIMGNITDNTLEKSEPATTNTATEHNLTSSVQMELGENKQSSLDYDFNNISAVENTTSPVQKRYPHLLTTDYIDFTMKNEHPFMDYGTNTQKTTVKSETNYSKYTTPEHLTHDEFENIKSPAIDETTNETLIPLQDKTQDSTINLKNIFITTEPYDQNNEIFNASKEMLQMTERVEQGLVRTEMVSRQPNQPVTETLKKNALDNLFISSEFENQSTENTDIPTDTADILNNKSHNTTGNLENTHRWVQDYDNIRHISQNSTSAQNLSSKLIVRPTKGEEFTNSNQNITTNTSAMNFTETNYSLLNQDTSKEIPEKVSSDSYKTSTTPAFKENVSMVTSLNDQTNSTVSTVNSYNTTELSTDNNEKARMKMNNATLDKEIKDTVITYSTTTKLSEPSTIRPNDHKKSAVNNISGIYAKIVSNYYEHIETKTSVQDYSVTKSDEENMLNTNSTKDALKYSAQILDQNQVTTTDMPTFYRLKYKNVIPGGNDDRDKIIQQKTHLVTPLDTYINSSRDIHTHTLHKLKKYKIIENNMMLGNILKSDNPYNDTKLLSDIMYSILGKVQDFKLTKLNFTKLEPENIIYRVRPTSNTFRLTPDTPSQDQHNNDIFLKIFGEIFTNNATEVYKSATNLTQVTKFFRDFLKTTKKRRIYKMNGENILKIICENNEQKCKMTPMKVTLLKPKIRKLKNITHNVFKSLKIVKGLLNSIGIGEEQFHAEVQSNNRIMKEPSADHDEKNNQVDMDAETIQLKYLKENLLQFITNIGEFSILLDDVVKIVATTNSTDDSVVKQPHDHQIDTVIIMLKDLLRKYDTSKHSFIKKIEDLLTFVEQKLDAKLHQDIVKRNLQLNGNRMFIESHTNNIRKNLRKLRDLIQKIKTDQSRQKRGTSSDCDYLLILLECLLNEISPLESSSDAIDILIEAIRSAPDVRAATARPAQRMASESADYVALDFQQHSMLDDSDSDMSGQMYHSHEHGRSDKRETQEQPLTRFVKRDPTSDDYSFSSSSESNSTENRTRLVQDEIVEGSAWIKTLDELTKRLSSAMEMSGIRSEGTTAPNAKVQPSTTPAATPTTQRTRATDTSVQPVRYVPVMQRQKTRKRPDINISEISSEVRPLDVLDLNTAPDVTNSLDDQ